jgi:hypothetical protein
MNKVKERGRRDRAAEKASVDPEVAERVLGCFSGSPVGMAPSVEVAFGAVYRELSAPEGEPSERKSAVRKAPATSNLASDTRAAERRAINERVADAKPAALTSIRSVRAPGDRCRLLIILGLGMPEGERQAVMLEALDAAMSVPDATEQAVLIVEVTQFLPLAEVYAALGKDAETKGQGIVEYYENLSYKWGMDGLTDYLKSRLGKWRRSALPSRARALLEPDGRGRAKRAGC